jgi:hypothetical protein
MAFSGSDLQRHVVSITTFLEKDPREPPKLKPLTIVRESLTTAGSLPKGYRAASISQPKLLHPNLRRLDPIPLPKPLDKRRHRRIPHPPRHRFHG